MKVMKSRQIEIESDEHSIFLKMAGNVYRPIHPIDSPHWFKESCFYNHDTVKGELIPRSSFIMITQDGNSEIWFDHGQYRKFNGTLESNKVWKPNSRRWI